jgi:glycosyltransferase involved in cell wall biosynthesis
MPPITALLHTANHALRLGRALEMLLPCSEIVIVDHGSTDGTRRIARRYGARVVSAGDHAPAKHYLDLARNEWIFCLKPQESITESLQASLFEWSALPESVVAGGYSVFVREQTGDGWLELPAPETRLIPSGWSLWREGLPAHDPSAVVLEGQLLRFSLP